MNSTRSTSPAVAAPKTAAPIPQPESKVRTEVRSDLHNSVRSSTNDRKSLAFGLPCANCRLYYPANLDSCPACNSKERISPNTVPASPKPQAAAEPVPENVLEQEREAFLKEFKSQLFAAHAEVSSAPVVCTLGEHHAQGA